MTIGIDVRILGGSEEGGIAQYVINLLPKLFQVDRSIKFKLFFNSFRSKKISYDWLSEKNVELFKFNIPNHLLFASAKLFNRPFIDKILGGVDVFFSPHFFLAPLSKNCKSVVTFHDLSFVRYPEFFSRRKNFWHNFEMNPKKQAREADKIIAMSCSTRNDLVSTFGINPDKIKVIYSGVSDKFFNKPEKNQVEAIKNKHKLPEKFFLFLGTIEPRKNVLGVLKAFEFIKSKKLISDDINLVIAGSLGWLYQDVLDFYTRSAYKNFIKFIGFVAEEDKVTLYSLARVFVYPSFFEGFGLPLLESMAAGVPTVTSRISSLPEVSGNSALLVDPYNIKSIAEAMSALFLNPNLHSHFSQSGRERARQFSWKKTAEDTLKTLVG